MKLCKDCKHFRPQRFINSGFAVHRMSELCASELATGTDLVLGGPIKADPYFARSDACGKEAKFWEAKDGQ